MPDAGGSGYYAGKTLLLTGATGLVGKALVEVVLRSLPEVRRLYVLLRPRADAAGNAVSVERRLREDLLASSAFDALRARHGDGFEAFALAKVEALDGELARDRLGLDPATYERLRDEVDVVIGNGALAVFDAPLDHAVQANTLGPMRLLDFARGAPRPPFVAHVSTCYVSNVGGPVFETPLPADWTPAGPDAADPYDVDREVERLLELVARVRAGDVGGRRAAGPPSEREATRRLVREGLRWARRRGWNDTYTFTKAMGEQLFARHRGDVPGLILRPAVIESALRTPSPGWIDGFRMLDPLIVGYARRQLTEFPGNPEAVLDVVPVDAVVNALLMTIPFTHEAGGPDVYQVASGAESPLRLKAFRDHVREHYRRAPLRPRNASDAEAPEVAFPEAKRFLRRLEYGYLLPTRVLVAAYRPLHGMAWGRRRRNVLKARLARLTWLRNMALLYGPYAESRARFLAFNVRRAWQALSAADRATFAFELRALDWRRYLQEVHLPGVERHLLGLGDQRAAPVELTAAGVAAEPSPGPRRDWGAAEKMLAPTRATTAAEAAGWTAPLSARLFRRFTLRAIRLAARLRLELAWEGREHLPERGPFILAANHTSHVDTGVLLAALGYLARHTFPIAAADYWFRRPAVASLLRATLGGIPFDRLRRNVPQALALPAQVLRNGHALIFFPEGTRSLDGTLQPFRSTVGLLALAAAAPIVPAHVTGAAQALPKGRIVIAHHPVRVRFGPPIAVEPYLGRLDEESVASVSRRMAQAAHDAVRALGLLGQPHEQEARS